MCTNKCLITGAVTKVYGTTAGMHGVASLLGAGITNGQANVLFLHGAQDKGVANAATQVSGLELGGLFGSLSSGAISDHLVRNNDGTKGNVGLRVQARRAPQ